MNHRFLPFYGFVVALALSLSMSAIRPAVADTPEPKNQTADAATRAKIAAAQSRIEKLLDARDAAADHRLADTTRYLASPQLEGRGLGTHGLELAGDYIARQFKEIGLKTDLYDGQPFERITLSLGSEIGPEKQNRLELIGPPPGNDASAKKAPQATSLKLGADFNPLAIGGSHKFDAPVVFVGYGITAKEEKYDDYAGLDVKGKVVDRAAASTATLQSARPVRQSRFAVCHVQPQNRHGRRTWRRGRHPLQR